MVFGIAKAVIPPFVEIFVVDIQINHKTNILHTEGIFEVVQRKRHTYAVAWNPPRILDVQIPLLVDAAAIFLAYLLVSTFELRQGNMFYTHCCCAHSCSF